ncbi:MAG: transglutaminase domain-containing protein [Bacillota bacterium]
MNVKIGTRHRLAFLLLWTLFVLYPNPLRLVQSVYRVFEPPLDEEAVEHLLPGVPRDPAELEAHVLAEYPYRHDWATYRVPWYFPTVGEALERGAGDCKTRFVILASLFEALEVNYIQTFSVSHFWLTYEGKGETALETASNAWLVRGEEGSRLQIPREDTRQIWRIFREAFWDAMPPLRKALFLLGAPLAVLLHLPLGLLIRLRGGVPEGRVGETLSAR